MTVDQAVVKAKDAMETLFPDFASRGLSLEEAETPAALGRWRFTFSAATPEAPADNSLADLLRPRRTRKAVELEAESGELVSIKAA